MKKAKPASPRNANSIDVHIAGQIRRIRLERNMSQDELGEAIVVSFQQIQKYERAANRVSAGRLYEICVALDFSISQIFEGMTPKPR
ncbi:helix-turn-helix transcriptional regulator [Tardiphaga sp. P9-11]|uniref:helix-turn-helix domain-containing protein n=1 Tax=Tardiphaga sp. P9-11 TaxID=2024614 RepID=UPI0011F302C8|nr:helix-turn-helix transcriptional regulator [Tardiphaga sp. P9-11]KAA0070466.1 XRE family transcriptional regulator [Tardiphaga sp. P9-11]